MASEGFQPNMLDLARDVQKDLAQQKEAIDREEREFNTQCIGSLLAEVQYHAELLRARAEANQNNPRYPVVAAKRLVEGLEGFAKNPTYAKYKHIKDELDKSDHGEFAGFDRFPEHRGWAQVTFYLAYMSLFLILSSSVIVGSLGCAGDGSLGLVFLPAAWLAVLLCFSPILWSGNSTASERAAYDGCDSMKSALDRMRQIPKKPEEKESIKEHALVSTTASSRVAFFTTMRDEGQRMPEGPIELPKSMQTWKSWLRQKR